MATVNINGVVYEGDNIFIQNGKVTIDGKVQSQSLTGEVEVVVVKGQLLNLMSDASVQCGNVDGDVSARGSVQCANVGGDVIASGSVTCGSVGGDVSASGSVICT